MRTAVILLGVLMFIAAGALADDTIKVVPATPVKAAADTAKAAAGKVVVKPVAPTKAVADTAKAAAGKAVVTPAAKEVKGTVNWVTTKTGLRYADHVVGKGDEAAKGDTVEVHYTGWLNEGGKHGKKFDSSVDRGTPFVFPLGAASVIKGWDEGVAGMKVGGKRELVIPPDLGYGARNVGDGLIPPNSTLIFEVELLKVHKPKK